MATPKARKKMKIAAIVAAIYVAASGPLGGLASLGVDHSSGGARDLAWNVYYGHIIAYVPIIYFAKFTGTKEVLRGYWEMCGWRSGVPF
ncbi:MAG TPA: hypothetical protein VGM64_00360 [Lacunisphaera sp.]|jgi:hypothetical protein